MSAPASWADLSGIVDLLLVNAKRADPGSRAAPGHGRGRLRWPDYRLAGGPVAGPRHAAGKLADLVVLSEDPTAVAPGRIAGLEVLATLAGGEYRYDSGAIDGLR